MQMHQAHTHEELLTLANTVAAAASDADREQLTLTTTRLSDEMAAHIITELPALLRVSRPAKRLALAAGQKRILEMLREVLWCAEYSTPGACRCGDLVQELLLELTIQVQDEELAGISGSERDCDDPWALDRAADDGWPYVD